VTRSARWRARWSWRGALALGLLSACSCGGNGESPAEEPSAEASSGAASAPGSVEPEPAPATEGPPSAPPPLELASSVDPYARVTLSVVNRTDETQHLASRLIVEREADGFVAAEELGAFTLGAELAEDGCVALAPGAELRGTWSCLRADAPDLVRDCAMAPAGRYRFAVTSCDGRARTDGEPFAYARE
jgi:hypothetical protein